MNKNNSLNDKLYTKFSDDCGFVPDNGKQQTLAEVFTPKLVVDLMLQNCNLEKNNNFEASIFEPGCGTGNFTIEILAIKLKKVCLHINKIENIKTKLKEYQINSLLALASITFVDIDSKNILYVRDRLKNFMINKFNQYIKANKSKVKIPENYLVAINSILDVNGVCADLLNKKAKSELLIVRYARSGDWIGRYVYQLDDIINLNTSSILNLFAEEDLNVPKYEDEIKFNKWIKQIGGKDICKQNSKLKK